jgi:hypothetical protein
MFAQTVLVYPALLALLALGAGLLVERASAVQLPLALLPVLGAAALIALSQLCTYVAAIAPATPYVLAAAACAGFALGRNALRARAREAWRERAWWVAALPLSCYALAIAPVLLSGRASFSSYLALADSAVHMAGAEYLVHHGQSYAHLDLRNSYGQMIDTYYNSSYPSGADTLFGGSALLLRVPLIWAFQPFCAFVLAAACGPAWTIARACGLNRPYAAGAALCATLGALVYGYELVGSIKEIVALGMILELGGLIAVRARWLGVSVRGAIPFALVAAAGVSALGIGFGPWALAAAAVPGVVLLGDLRAGRASPRIAIALALCAGAAAAVAALPTWADLSGSVHVAETIAASSNPGNLRTPLHWEQVFGVWLHGSYKQLPSGPARPLSYALIALALGAGVLGVVALARRGRPAMAAWLLLTGLVLVALDLHGTTWVDAKGLTITSPIVVLSAWAGIGALAAGAVRVRALGTLAAALALALLAGTLASDAAQYHTSNLAPTARYEELRSVNSRFAHRGPALFTDFDEYALYELRDLDVGGPNFVFAPPALAASAGGHGRPVELQRAPLRALLAYSLIITRIDPSAAPPPAAYALLWQGHYYRVWGRRPGADGALARTVPGGEGAHACARELALARLATARRLRLVAAGTPELVRIGLHRERRPRGWGRQRDGFVMARPGRLTASFAVRRSGSWDLWLQGQFMTRVAVAIDGRPVASVEGQLGGNSLVTDTVGPFTVRLGRGVHRLSVARGDLRLAPGDGGAAVLDGAFLTPAGSPARSLRELSPRPAAGTLCTGRYDWIALA